MAEPGNYYALHSGDEIAFLDRGKSEDGQLLALAVYTAPDGDAQRGDLDAYQDVEVRPVSRDQLLDTIRRGVPNTVFLDGHKLAGSVFLGMLKEEMGLPIRNPRLIKPDDPPRG